MAKLYNPMNKICVLQIIQYPQAGIKMMKHSAFLEYIKSFKIQIISDQMRNLSNVRKTFGSC